MDVRRSFDVATDIEDVRHESFETQTRVVSQSIFGAVIEEWMYNFYLWRIRDVMRFGLGVIFAVLFIAGLWLM